MWWKTGLFAVLCIILHQSVLASEEVTFLDNAFDSPIQTWQDAENGSLYLGGATPIYGFNNDDIDSDNRISVKVKNILDNFIWKVFCHLGYGGSSDSYNGFLCSPKNNKLLVLDNIPKFGVTFDDVRNISISNNSFSVKYFYDVSGELKLPPGNYGTVSIQTDKSVYLPSGNYKIKNLILSDSVNLSFSAGSSIEIETLTTNSWFRDKIVIMSDANNLKIKNATIYYTDLYLNSGSNRFENLSPGLNSTLHINDAKFYAYRLSVSNGSEVYFNTVRGEDNLKIYEYSMSGSSNRAYFSRGDYFIKHFFNSYSNNELIFDDDVTIVSNTVYLSGDYKQQKNKVNIYALDDKYDPTIFGYASFDLLGSSNLCANAFSRRNFNVSGFGNFSGAVIADRTVLSGSASIHYFPGNACSESEISTDIKYNINIYPELDYSLICEPLLIKFSVISVNGSDTVYQGRIKVSPDESLLLVDGKGTKISDGIYKVNSNGELWFQISSGGKSGKLNLSGVLLDSADMSSVSGDYHFVPYKLSADDQYVIASKPHQVTITAQTCDANGSPKDLAYQGTPTVSSEWQAPANGVGDLTFNPTFTEGEATADLVMDDSGIKTVLLEDSNFSCRELGEDCPIKGKGTLQGSFTVYSRPWTLAICSPNDSSSMDGNITDRSSTAFTAAGSNFALNVRPLRWKTNGDEQDAIETSTLCAWPVTQNFFADAAQLTAMTELSYQLAQPEEGDSGTLNGILAMPNYAGENNSYLPFSDLSWSEVGVLRVQAAIRGQYLGMTVNPGYRDIGRFYPAWLSLSANDWDYPDGHTGFAYMNQPFGYGFSVAAQNRQGQVTKNYSSFDPALIADIKLLAVDSSGAELGARISDYDLQFWDGSGSWSDGVLSGEHSLTFSKLVSNSSPYTTSADGPFNSGFGLRVTDKVDGVDFAAPQLALKQNGTPVDNGQVFALQPDIRYGRMVLDDVGGAVTSVINVPLRVEYWQGSRFVTNRDDNGSWFRSSSNSICRQSIWTSDAGKSNSSLEPRQEFLQIPKVAAGESDQLMAEPHSKQEQNSVREQVRFWLRLDDSSTSSPQLADSSVTCGPQGADNPWLQYNWRGVGDEDPSAVVTFGVHRGNDRVIFRGEARLTGQ